MLLVFQGIVDIKPTYSSEEAVSYIVKKGEKEKFLNFILHEGKWYISDRQHNPIKKD